MHNNASIINIKDKLNESITSINKSCIINPANSNDAIDCLPIRQINLKSKTNKGKR